MTRTALPAPTVRTARLRLRPFDDADADGATSTDIPLQTLAGSALVNVLA